MTHRAKATTRCRFGDLDDTAPEAHLVQMEYLRKLGMAGRLAVTFDEMRKLREMALAGIRLRYPGASEEEARLRFLELTLPPELFGDYLNWYQTRRPAG